MQRTLVWLTILFPCLIVALAGSRIALCFAPFDTASRELAHFLFAWLGFSLIDLCLVGGFVAFRHWKQTTIAFRLSLVAGWALATALLLHF